MLVLRNSFTDLYLFIVSLNKMRKVSVLHWRVAVVTVGSKLRILTRLQIWQSDCNHSGKHRPPARLTLLSRNWQGNGKYIRIF